MKISELIKKLEAVKSAEGDIEVVIQHRDEGGDYDGVTNYLYFATMSNLKNVTLIDDKGVITNYNTLEKAIILWFY